MPSSAVPSAPPTPAAPEPAPPGAPVPEPAKPEAAAPGPAAGKTKRSRLKRALRIVAVALVLLAAGLWYGVNHVSWLGPMVADTLRAVIGTEAVTRLEAFAYGVQDRWNQLVHSGDKPEPRWEIPPAPSASEAPAPPPIDGGPTLAPFHPRDPGPLFPTAAAAGDGVWVPVDLPGAPVEPTLMWKTLIHPDLRRPWAEIYAVAIDLRRVRLFSVAGTDEPRSLVPESRSYVRTGIIPEAQRRGLLAAFNGGFKAEHGKYGMMIDGVTLITPRPDACTVGCNGDGTLRIGTWKALGDDARAFAWWRQAPPCLVEDDKLHPGLSDENTNWGAALGGETVIRRSAIGLDAARAVLFMAVSNATTVRSLGVGMKHLGASTVAQLDINFSYPRFALFRGMDQGKPEAFGLFPGFSVKPEEYAEHSSPRDFFYLLRAEPGKGASPL